MSTIEPNEIEQPAMIDQGVWPPPPVNQRAPEYDPSVQYFERQNIFVLLLLCIVTFGFYPLFWLMRQAKAVNKSSGATIILPYSIWMLAAVWVVDVGCAFLHVGENLDRSMSFIGNVAWLIATFMLRTALNDVFRARPGNPAFSGKLGTFFFGVVYLQHKINTFLKNSVAH